MSKILVTCPIPPELRSVLEREHDLVEIKRGAEKFPNYDIAVTTSIAGADIALFEQIPDLRLLLCNGAGFENIDLPAAAERDIIVRNTPDEVTGDTADFAIALIYATSRRLVEADQFVRSGRWAKEKMSPSKRTFELTVGIVGLGKIGKTIAARASGIGMTVLYTGPRAKADQPYEHIPSIGDLAERSDMLVLSCPGGSATHHIVNRAVLERLGKEGTLINVSRGSVVKEDDLIEALEQGAIKAAGLDVFATEPKIDPRFLKLQNVVLAPHYAAVTLDTRYGIANTLAQAVRDFRAGGHVYNAAVSA